MGNPAKKTLFAALAIAATAFVVWRGVLDLSLYAWDTFPLIAASRVASASDFAHLFTRELMDGRFPGGHFYRPLVELSFALDHALWGLDARGYHVTDLLILAVASALCVRLAARVTGASHAHWAVLAGLFYLLHPVQFEILPLPPRRADALSAMFVVLAAGTQMDRARWRTALACLCAIASKETGVVAAPLVLAFAVARSREPNFAARVRSGWRTSWPSFALLAVFLVARTMVLGGLGGGTRASVSAGVGDLPGVVERYGTLVLAPLPPPWISNGSLALALGAAVLIGLGIAVASSRARSVDEAALEPRAAVCVVAFWFALLVGVTAIAGMDRAWYALPFVAPLALLVALAASYRDASVPRRALTMLAVLALALLQGWASDRSQRWEEVRDASDAAVGLLTKLDGELAHAVPGSTLELDVFPLEGPKTRHGRDTKQTAIFAPYSLDAWAELKHPARKVRFEAKRGEAEIEPPAADEVLVLLISKAVKQP